MEQVVNHISKCLFVIPLKDYVGQWPNATLEESHDYTLYVYILLLQIALPLETIQIPAHCHYESETGQ